MTLKRLFIFALPFFIAVVGIYFFTPRLWEPSSAAKPVNESKIPTVQPKWTYKIGGSIYSSVALDPSGNVYVAGEDGYVYSISPDGQKRWDFQTGAAESTPVYAADTLYVATIDGQLYAINADGTKRWQSNIGSHRDRGAPAVTKYGIFAECHFGSICSVSPTDGSEQWQSNGVAASDEDDDQPRNQGFHLSEHNASAINTDGKIVIGALRGQMVEVRPEDGQLQWTYSREKEPDLKPNEVWSQFNAPALAPDGTIYVGNTSRNLYAFNSAGEKQWIVATEGPVNGSPVVASDGTIYFGSDDKTFYAVAPNGTVKWKLALDGAIDSAPAIGSDGTVFVATAYGKLYAIAPDGKVMWLFGQGNGKLSSPAIGADGTVYVASWSGNVYAISSSSGGLAQSPWPKYHHDNGNSGVQTVP